MFEWMRRPRKSQDRKEPYLTVTPASAGRSPPDLEKDVKCLSLTEVIQRISALPETAPFGVMTAIVHRLYHIAFFDHGVSDFDREKAAKLTFAIKENIRKQLDGDPDRRPTFEKATQLVESRIPYEGVNSLFWLLEEHDIPGPDTFPFIMRPEHGSKLGPYLEMMSAEVLHEGKPHMVRELVLQRQGRVYPNTVLHLHALACSGDPATLAIFTKAEISALIQAPYDYGAARQVLADLGLLAPRSNALRLTPAPSDTLLQFVVSQTTLDILAERPFGLVVERVLPPPNMEGLDRVAPVALCVHLGLTMIEALYDGEKRFLAMDGIEAQFSKAADAGLLKLVGMMKNLERLALTGEITSGEFNVDQMMIFAAWQEFGLWPDTEGEWTSLQPYLRYLLQILRHVRAVYLIRLRCYLRYFIHGQSNTSALPADALADFRNRIDGFLGEDWIGKSA